MRKMIPDMSDEGRKEFVQAWLQGQIFSSCHLARDGQERMLGQVFYPVLFGAVGPPQIKVPELPEEIPEDMSVEDWDALVNGGHDDAASRIKSANDKLHGEFKQQLGLIWEFAHKCLPRSINGYPIFMSCNVMSLDDRNRIWPILQREEKRLANIEV